MSNSFNSNVTRSWETSAAETATATAATASTTATATASTCRASASSSASPTDPFYPSATATRAEEEGGGGGGGNPFAFEVMPRYSEGEEKWIQTQLRHVRESYDLVPFGPDIVVEYAAYNRDVPFSKAFMPAISRVWAERYRRVMKAHPEFAALRDDDQVMKCRRFPICSKKKFPRFPLVRIVLYLLPSRTHYCAKCHLDLYIDLCTTMR